MILVLKKVAFIIACICTFPFVLVYRTHQFFGQTGSLFLGIGQILSLFPGKVGSYLRVAFYHQVLPSFSKSTYLGFGSYFSHAEVEVGEGVYIGAYCIIGRAQIGKHCTIGSFVNILSGKKQHNFEEIDEPIQAQGGAFEEIRVGENCWIGNGATIMANIGKQCIIGAGSVLTKDTGDYEVVAGNPAKMIRRLSFE